MSYIGLASRRRDFRRHLGWLAAGLGALSVVAIILLLSTVALSNRQRDAALAEEQRSFSVMLLARELESTLTRAEASLGRYMMSGNSDFGRAYYEDWRRGGVIMTRLERVTAHDAGQQALLRDLRTTYDRRGVELADSALRMNYGQKMNALGMFYQAGRAESLERMGALLRQLIGDERANLARRTGHARELVVGSNRIAGLLSIFGIALILGAGLLAWLTARAIGQRHLTDLDMEAVAIRAELLEDAVGRRTVELRDANDRLRAEAEERAATEAKLRQVQKMEAVGKLTGGIAHDFNNMLAVVIGGLELARRRLPTAPDEAVRQIDSAMEGAERAAALTRRLLAFSRAETLMPAAHDASALIGGMIDLVDRTLGERIRVETGLAPTCWPVWVDRHQLENAVLNLAVNARDAIDGDGILRISTDNVTLRAGEAGSLPAGDYVAIRVADTGTGMTPEVLDRVFEPFFTTKPVGQGTGLGLSQVFGFAGQSGGTALIDSAPGQGTTVSLFLPRHAAAAVQPVREPSAPAAPVAAGPATVLVVEDDQRVLAATIGALADLGHRPIPCPGPLDAAALLAANPDIRLILSDVVMPGVTGPELVADLVARRPDLGVLFVTGFTGDAEEADFGGHMVLRKPYTMSALSRAVDGVLDRLEREAA